MIYALFQDQEELNSSLFEIKSEKFLDKFFDKNVVK